MIAPLQMPSTVSNNPVGSAMATTQRNRADRFSAGRPDIFALARAR
jgi:hypothetical protein